MGNLTQYRPPFEIEEQYRVAVYRRDFLAQFTAAMTTGPLIDLAFWGVRPRIEWSALKYATTKRSTAGSCGFRVVPPRSIGNKSKTGYQSWSPTTPDQETSASGCCWCAVPIQTASLVPHVSSTLSASLDLTWTRSFASQRQFNEWLLDDHGEFTANAHVLWSAGSFKLAEPLESWLPPLLSLGVFDNYDSDYEPDSHYETDYAHHGPTINPQFPRIEPQQRVVLAMQTDDSVGALPG